MTAPIRIQRKMTRGFDLQAVSLAANGLDCVYVGRPTMWGNPYAVSKHRREVMGALAVDWFREVISEFPIPVAQIKRWQAAGGKMCHLFMMAGPGANSPLSHLKAIKGKNLACWCPLDRPCHADVLLVAANPECFPEKYNLWFEGK